MSGAKKYTFYNYFIAMRLENGIAIAIFAYYLFQLKS